MAVSHVTDDEQALIEAIRELMVASGQVNYLL